jgi:hypothetical protein
MIYKHNINHVKHKHVIILTLKCQIFAHQGLKTKEIFCKEKTTDFILQGRKPKFTIKVGTENIFYPRKNDYVRN